MPKHYYRAQNLKNQYRINHQIVAKTMRVIDEHGKQIGIFERDKAVELAHEKEVDLVEIAPNADPPVVKVIDFKKFLYQLKKKQQEEKKKTIVSITKEIRLGPFIGEHDLEIKLKRAKEFLNDRNKVRFVIRFKGREMAKKDMGETLLKRVMDEKLKELAKIEREIRMEGRQMSMIVSRIK